jgi:hypothetical protein
MFLYVAMVVQYVASVCFKYSICFSNVCCKCFYVFLQVFQMQPLSVLFVFRYMFANVSSRCFKNRLDVAVGTHLPQQASGRGK